MPILAIINLPAFALAAALSQTACSAPGAPTSSPPDGAAPVEENEQAGEDSLRYPDPEVDKMLDELEKADRGMRDLRASISYDRIDQTLGDRQYRYGELLFLDRSPKDARNRAGMRSFVVRFRTYADLDGRRDLNESWAFDGRWLIERNDDDKAFRKREITHAGEEVDPLRLGEGPLPIPIGQRKADILSRYAVEMVDPVDSLEPPREPADTDTFASYREIVRETLRRTEAVQLKLTPLRKEDGEFDSIRLWYLKDASDQDRWLPLMARAARTNSRGREVDIAFVLMGQVKINQGIPDAQMLVAEPDPDAGYTTQVDRLPVEAAE